MHCTVYIGLQLYKNVLKLTLKFTFQFNVCINHYPHCDPTHQIKETMDYPSEILKIRCPKLCGLCVPCPVILILLSQLIQQCNLSHPSHEIYETKKFRGML